MHILPAVIAIAMGFELAYLTGGILLGRNEQFLQSTPFRQFIKATMLGSMVLCSLFLTVKILSAATHV
ncbi:MAG TPA: hypothetical protein VKA49_09950 [Flavitalea sp.]|nr:hypothetical protein [Flavitalea sp.]